jgi:hypothetical protein
MSVLANTMNRAERRAAAAYLSKENAKFPEHMVLWHPRDWPEPLYLRDLRKRGADLAPDMESASKLLQHSSLKLTSHHYRTKPTKLRAVR